MALASISGASLALSFAVLPTLTPLSTLALLQAGSPPQGPGRFLHPGQGGPTEEEKERARVRIGITREQQSQIETVFRESDAQMNEVRSKFRELSQQLYTLYDSYDFDRGVANNLRRDLLRLHKKMADIHAENEEKLRRILNREQFEKMRALMKEERDKRRKAFEERRRSDSTKHP